MSRTAIATLSTENLLHNLAVIKEKAPRSKVIGMVKANAYGHGLRSVSLRLQHHVDLLGVASIDEALALRKAGVVTPIILMEGVFEPQELLIAATEGFHVVFHASHQIEWLAHITIPLPIHAWLKIDTGMGRLGFPLDHAHQAYEQLHNQHAIDTPIRIMSHFACSEDKNNPLNMKQIHAFIEWTKTIPKTEYSLCNSGGIFNFPDYQFDFVRPGISLYGASPFEQVTAHELNLKPVMTLQTNLIAVRMFKKGSTLGYGARYTCPEDMPVGVIAFGYGDGYPRSIKDGAPVLINGVECQIAGRISMDMLTVDLRRLPTARIGDHVVLWGMGLPVEKVAQFTNNVCYDLLTGVKDRVKFYWTRYPTSWMRGT